MTSEHRAALSQVLDEQVRTTQLPAEDYLAVLTALAFARAPGAPREVWATMAATVANKPEDPCQDRHRTPGRDWDQTIDAVLHGPLGAFVTTTTDGDQPVFCTHTITDTLRDGATLASDTPQAVNARIATALAGLIPADGAPDLYTCRHLVGHATDGNTLDDQTIPGRFWPWDTSRAVRGALGLPLPDDPRTQVLSAWAAVEPYLDQIPTVAERRTALHFQLLGRRGEQGWRTWTDRNVLLHAPDLRCMAVGMADGRPLLATGGWDATVQAGTVRLWDLHTGIPAGPPLKGGYETMVSLAFGQVRGRPVIAAGSDAGRLRVWDLATSEAILERDTAWVEPCSWVEPVTFGQLDGRTVLASSDGTVQVWDLDTGEPFEPLQGDRGLCSVAFGEVDGTILASNDNDDGTVQVWDLSTGEPVGEPLQGDDGLWSVAFGRLDGRTVVATSNDSDDGMVQVWDLATGEPVGKPLRGHTSWVRSFAFGHLEGRTILATGSEDATAQVWDLDTSAPVGQPLRGHTEPVLSVAFTQLAGRTVVATGSHDHTVRVWDLDTRDQANEPVHDHSSPVQTVAFARVAGRPVLATSDNDGTVRVWDLTTGDPVSQPLQGHTDQADQGPLADDPRLPEFFGPAWPKVPRVRSAAIGQLEGRAVVTTGSEDDTVQVWDLDTNEPVGDPLPHTSRVFSAVFGQLEGRTILATGNYDGTVRLWDPTSGRPAAPAIHALAPVNDLAVSDGVLALATDAGLAVLGPEFLATVLDTPGQDQP